jgi:hypothetical protein
MSFPWFRLIAALALSPIAAALFAALFYGPIMSIALWNFGPDKSLAFKLLMPLFAIAFWGTILGAGFSLLAATVTQLPLVLWSYQVGPIALTPHLFASAVTGLALFWFVFPFPMAAPAGPPSPQADGGLLMPIFLGLGGGIGLGLLWHWLVISKLPAHV